MNREQMIDKAAQVHAAAEWNDESVWTEGFGDEGRELARGWARAVLDAILPQVTTVAELEALPRTALVLKDFGRSAQVERAGSLARAGRHLGPEFLPESPMTVVWIPEAVTS